ncbi:MAG TPA: hypothetical protein VFE34_14445 [Dongiaceae bacterium]|jgi:hypothetical protein|nr:hypothetical protein [Dongiaceae bacterium]
MSLMAGLKAGSGIAKRQLALRNQLWPGAEDRLWHRSTNKGFATIPKTMPVILKVMDGMSKGQPVSSTYLALWCATWDNSFVSLKPRDLAFAAGFSGQRGERTWATRMRLLKGLGFIDIKPGKGGEFGYALIFNPHRVIREHYEAKTPGLVAGDYTALVELAIDVGAKDMVEPAA